MYPFRPRKRIDWKCRMETEKSASAVAVFTSLVGDLNPGTRPMRLDMKMKANRVIAIGIRRIGRVPSVLLTSPLIESTKYSRRFWRPPGVPDRDCARA